MICAVTLTADEFKQVHNALCSLRSVRETIEGIVREPITDKLAMAIFNMEQGLQGAYEQESKDFHRRGKHYDSVKEDLGIRGSEWSIYEVSDLNEPHPFGDVDCVVYDQHWGEKDIAVKVNGSTWAALWVSANACIRDSGDQHHVFIERLTPIKGTKNLRLSTGS